MTNVTTWFWTMDLSARLIALRKQQSLSQQAMADAVGLHVNQIKRYEAGTAQPSLEGIKKLAVALHVTIDSLLFDETERGPDEDLRLQFEALSAMSPEEKHVAKSVLEAMIVKHQVTGAVAGTLARVTTQTTKPAAKGKKPSRERVRA